VLELLIEFDHLKINHLKELADDNKGVIKSAMQISIYNLVKTIRRWYSHSPIIL
jgi:hypothetical protein